MSSNVVAAILAAGASTRFGSPKQLAKIASNTLIQIALDTLSRSRVDETCVVLGCAFETINNHVQTGPEFSGGRFTVLNNTNWPEGLSSSIRCATAFAKEREATNLLLMLCDQPFVTSVLIDQLIESSDNCIASAIKQDLRPLGNIEQRCGDGAATSLNERMPKVADSIVACRYGESVGTPAIFPQKYFAQLLQLQGDKGAKSIILSSDAPVYLDFAEGTFDIDLTSDLPALVHSAHFHDSLSWRKDQID